MVKSESVVMYKENKMIDLDKEIQFFFDSVLKILSYGKIFTNDVKELNRIEVNSNLVKNIKNNYFYFKETYFFTLGAGITQSGFKQFDKENVSLFYSFNDILQKIFVFHNQAGINKDELLGALKNWDSIKPGYMSNTFKYLKYSLKQILDVQKNEKFVPVHQPLAVKKNPYLRQARIIQEFQITH